MGKANKLDVAQGIGEPQPEEELLCFPEIEAGIPLPKNAKDALPELTPAEEVRMRAATIALLNEIQNKEIVPSEKSLSEAENLATQMVANPAFRPDYSHYPNETLAYLAGLVSQMNTSIVGDLVELKLYVVNKLIYEVEHAKDSKTRISALTKLGEIDGVDAFKRRTEITHKVQTMEEVESELFRTLNSLKERVIDAEVTVIASESAVNSPIITAEDVVITGGDDE